MVDDLLLLLFLFLLILLADALWLLPGDNFFGVAEVEASFSSFRFLFCDGVSLEAA